MYHSNRLYNNLIRLLYLVGAFIIYFLINIGIAAYISATTGTISYGPIGGWAPIILLLGLFYSWRLIWRKGKMPKSAEYKGKNQKLY